MNRYLLSHFNGEIGSKEVRDRQKSGTRTAQTKRRKWNSGYAKDQRTEIMVGAEENEQKE